MNAAEKWDQPRPANTTTGHPALGTMLETLRGLHASADTEVSAEAVLALNAGLEELSLPDETTVRSVLRTTLEDAIKQAEAGDVPGVIRLARQVRQYASTLVHEDVVLPAPDPTAFCLAMAEQPTPPRLMTGIATLDTATMGIPAGSLVVLNGAPGAGKTALAVQWADTWTRGGARIVYLAADQKPAAIFTRIGQREGLARDDLRGVTGDDARRAAWRTLADRLVGLPLRVLDGIDVTLEAALATLRALPGDGPLVLVLDAVQDVRCEAAHGAENRRDEIDATLKVIARAQAEGVLVLAISQTGRGYYAMGDRSPVGALAAAKESGTVEYKADLLLGLRSVAGSADEVDVEVAKNREGPQGVELRLRIDRRRADMTEIDKPAAPSRGGGPGDLDRRILAAVRDKTCASGSDVAKATGRNKGAVLAAVKAMKEDGRLVVVGGRFRPGEANGTRETPAAPASCAVCDGTGEAPHADWPAGVWKPGDETPRCEACGGTGTDAPNGGDVRSSPVPAVPSGSGTTGTGSSGSTPFRGEPRTGTGRGEEDEEKPTATDAAQAVLVALASGPVASFDAVRLRVALAGRPPPTWAQRGAWAELVASGKVVRQEGGKAWVLASSPSAQPPEAPS